MMGRSGGGELGGQKMVGDVWMCLMGFLGGYGQELGMGDVG